MNHQDIPPKPASPPPTGSLPAVPSGSNGSAPAPEAVTWSHPAPESPERRAPNRATFWKVFLAVVIVAVAGSLTWLAVWLNSSSGTDKSAADAPGVLQTTPTAPATPQPLPRDGVAPAAYAVGDCFKDFDPEALASTVVACDTGHSAQLVATYRYPDAAAYPGADPLKAKALEACQAATLGPAANQFHLSYQRSFPSSTSWDSGDRRVDCYVTSDTGNVITASVLP
ncbi:septum formation family protein [Pseudarthrobacter sp. fls2-241-R2A-127]|uniref:septum formation family protein n=1 Tax=Pseudarthrobacter sp. fls2-241-R2A-127 TaxID=3040303 RepID=UPI0025563DBB|nr:septum formation family protein [Pseudarthrobacter sp. fls2-241-R2A-127]